MTKTQRTGSDVIKSDVQKYSLAYVLFTRQQNVSFFKQRSHSTVSTYSIHDYFADEHQQPNYVPVTKASVYIPFAWFQMQVSSPAVSKDDD